ncbi:MAG TPA: antibiotic biosynthesis monooxygenase [Bryobacteraceae bacterium]|nr:antibiotic biosynthesis monooxygenase [Bryobacteraceae bacterium]
MLIVQVHVQVKSEFVEAFRQATIINAQQSITEPGIARFDVLRQADSPTHFVLIEVYRTADAVTQHRETPHYLTWRDSVADMMAVPRTRVEYENVFPSDESW